MKDRIFILSAQRELAVFAVVDEWARLQDDLACDIDGKHVDGPFVTTALARKYRIPELRLLVGVYGNDKKDAAKAKSELEKQDAEFMTDFEKANLKPLANALFRALNWPRAIVGPFERIYRRDKSRLEVNLLSRPASSASLSSLAAK